MSFYSEKKDGIIRFMRKDIDKSLLPTKQILIEKARKLIKKIGTNRINIKHPELLTLLKEVNNPLFEYIYVCIKNKNVAHLILKYYNMWCFHCYTTGKLNFHPFLGCGYKVKIYYPRHQLLIRNKVIDGDIEDIEVMHDLSKNSLSRYFSINDTQIYVLGIYNPDNVRLGFDNGKHIICPGTKLIFWRSRIFINSLKELNPL